MPNQWTAKQYEQYQHTGMTPEETTKHTLAIEKGCKRDEKKLQEDCEGLCEQRGYRRLVGANIAKHLSDKAVKGFFGHIPDLKRTAKGNIFLPDLPVFDFFGRCLLVELKVWNQYQPGQKEMIDAGLWVECRTVERFGDVLSEWETNQKQEVHNGESKDEVVPG